MVSGVEHCHLRHNPRAARVPSPEALAPASLGGSSIYFHCAVPPDAAHGCSIKLRKPYRSRASFVDADVISSGLASTLRGRHHQSDKTFLTLRPAGKVSSSAYV